MGYRGKFMTEHTGEIFPEHIAERYIDDYNIPQNEKGKYLINISSKEERKDHSDIINDLLDLLKNKNVEYHAIILWEDGRVDRINLVTGEWSHLSIRE